MSEQKGGIFSFYFRSNLLVRILIGLIVGAIFGIIFQNAGQAIGFLQPFGDLFIRLLKMIMVPVIVCTLIVGTSSISPAQLGKVGIKIIIFYLITSLFAIIIGLFVGAVIAPGEGMMLENIAGTAKEVKAPTLVQILLDIVPTNPFGSVAKGEVLPTIVFAYFLVSHLHFAVTAKMKRSKIQPISYFHFLRV